MTLTEIAKEIDHLMKTLPKEDNSITFPSAERKRDKVFVYYRSFAPSHKLTKEEAIYYMLCLKNRQLVIKWNTVKNEMLT